MSRTSHFVSVGMRKIELSNLKKILFPDDDILKAEVIEYYLKIAPTILGHVKGRPLSFVRYPNGIYGERFFQKNSPDWTPDWIDHIALGDEKKIDYILATEEASLVWLANLACLEIHQMHSYKPNFDKPDYIVFDLDPPEGYRFSQLIDIALNLRQHLEGFGYHAFVKTTGGKGVHLLLPIEPNYNFHTVFDVASKMAKPFVESNAQTTTLHIKKESRKGRVLVDIYRNRPSQTIVSPYSIRGIPGAPVSMPLDWDHLVDVKNPKEFNIQTAIDWVIHEGDAWEAMAAYAVKIHTDRKQIKKQKKDLKASRSYKTPEKLKKYTKKRHFEKTKEPHPEDVGGEGTAFVIHRHHASRLHYDLRLERDGTLKSWAVPKGLPPRPGIKRLAVAVEDHPIEYLVFDGEIPKGQYGGGRMWIYASGKYEITKNKKNGFYFRLKSQELNGEYRIYQTKDNNWILERVDTPQVNWVQDKIEPMLANSQSAPPESDEYIYEVKWDGIRASISIDEGELTIRSRNQNNISKSFPELLIPEKAFRATSALFDAEIVCLEDGGKPNFQHVINRLQQRSDSAIERGRKKFPVYCYVFDCLYLDGRSLINEPLIKRREWMIDAIRKDTPYRISESVDEGLHLFEAAKNMGLEGIVAKERTGRYHPGKRSDTWLKIKVRNTTECFILGYTKGKGDRASAFGALHISSYNGKGLNYLGKVGTGFDTRKLKSIFTELIKIKKCKRLIKEKPIDDSSTIWIEPRLICEVQYASVTKNGTLREPVFIRLRPDLRAIEN